MDLSAFHTVLGMPLVSCHPLPLRLRRFLLTNINTLRQQLVDIHIMISRPQKFIDLSRSPSTIPHHTLSNTSIIVILDVYGVLLTIVILDHSRTNRILEDDLLVLIR